MSNVIVERRGRLLAVTLDRPEAINSLTLEMVGEIGAALDRAEADPAVQAVLFSGSGERGFCAGGDIRALYESAKAGSSDATAFTNAEYALNLRISRFALPIVAFMDGIVMGGGIGLAGHASHRVATERLRAAMPEVGIGFFPDVGGLWLLSRAPGELGTHAALTGEQFGTKDALLLGLSDVEVTREQLPALAQALESAPPDEAIAEFTRGAGAGVGAGSVESGSGAAASMPDASGLGAAERGGSPASAQGADSAGLAGARVWIDACYVGDELEAIVAALRARDELAANRSADAIESKSPTSVTVTLAALRSAEKLPDLAAVLKQDSVLATAFYREPDFVEGIRAAIVDKDRTPRWSPATLAEVGDVSRFFEAT